MVGGGVVLGLRPFLAAGGTYWKIERAEVHQEGKRPGVRKFLRASSPAEPRLPAPRCRMTRQFESAAVRGLGRMGEARPGLLRTEIDNSTFVIDSEHCCRVGIHC